jgi:hypothetical protein
MNKDNENVKVNEKMLNKFGIVDKVKKDGVVVKGDDKI